MHEIHWVGKERIGPVTATLAVTGSRCATLASWRNGSPDPCRPSAPIPPWEICQMYEIQRRTGCKGPAIKLQMAAVGPVVNLWAWIVRWNATTALCMGHAPYDAQLEATAHDSPHH